MAHWIQELGTYKFQVVHHFGKGHGNADGLLRIPYEQCGYEELEGVVCGGGGTGRTSASTNTKMTA